MKIARSTLVLTLAGVALSLSATAGQLYKWTDANGRVQYSDTPPSNQPAQSLNKGSRPGTSYSTAVPEADAAMNTKSADPKATEIKTAPQTTADQEQAFRKRQAEKKEAEEKLAKAEADDKSRAADCQRAKEYLASLERGRMVTANEKGEQEFYSDAKIASEKERTRKQMETLCK